MDKATAGKIIAAALGGALLLTWGLWSPARRAQLPWVQASAKTKYLQLCAAPPSDALPSDALPSDALPSDALPSDALPSDAPRSDALFSEAELIATLYAHRGECAALESEVARALPQSPALIAWLEAVLDQGQGPEHLRLNATRALLHQSAPDRGRAVLELNAGALGPGSRSALLSDWSTLAEGHTLPLDPTGHTAARRYGSGDPSAKEELAAALERELLWPRWGLQSDAMVLTDGALEGLGWSSKLLEQALSDLEAGKPVQTLEGPVLRSLQRHGQTCSAPTPGCSRFLLEQLDTRASLPPIPLAPLAGLPARDLPLFHRAALDIQRSRDPAGRLLGLVAHPSSTYDQRAWEMGHRGAPALVLRYSGGTPGASAAAALLLSQLSGVPVQVQAGLVDGRTVLVLEAGGRRALVGTCGPGSALPSHLEPLTQEQVLELAAMERVAGFAAQGEVDQALDASLQIHDSGRWKEWTILHSSLLACQGIRNPEQPTPELAAQWAQACGQPELAEILLAIPSPDPAILASSSAHNVCGSSLWAPAPMEREEGGEP